MSKRVWVIWNDRYHARETYQPLAARLFGGAGWDVHASEDIRELLAVATPPALVVNFCAGRPEGQPALSPDEQRQLAAAVVSGMGMLYVHAGLTLIEVDTPLYELARGRFASHPPEQSPVSCAALPGVSHAILKGIAPFSAVDEHYFCQTALEGSQPFLYTTSIHGTEIGGWAHQRGAGRVACLTPGHTAAMLEQMAGLIANAAAWCAGQA
ncbi:MAG: ThuA domain-containing protein [Candidatus Latescibacteria bacterium]|nr:ThuA domain-containing protein [Candidatus Latescibacterota bacterium]